MSDLARSAMSARIAKLPPMPPPTNAPYHDDEGEEEDEADGLGDLPTHHRFRTERDLSAYAPIPASTYFAQALSVSVPASSLDFRIYYSPPSFPSSQVSPDTAATPNLKESTVLVCHHGAGYSGLSFACFAQEVTRASKGELGVMSLDARSHGRTKQLPNQDSEPTLAAESNPPAVDLSIETLTNDLVNLLQTVFPDPANAPSLLLLGHSMGGTVVVRACPRLQENKYRIGGVIVLDVVEGSALEAMPLMHGLLASRPAGFDSIEEAVEWHLNNKTIRNPTSARVSIPSLFVESPSVTSEFKYGWRAPLHLTAPFWTDWFTGLSNSFLGVRTARLLILAGTDRMDRTLMIGQMQGKFQLEVIPDVGHMLHEDDPTRIAELVTEFWKRNERLPIGVKVKVKKVGET
ncbi:Protein with carboxyl methyl esterase activity [Tulasnella sp. 403]|nr:Protein with carboxyl methyl esterase activity [Tulasnella sp. 403]